MRVKALKGPNYDTIGTPTKKLLDTYLESIGKEERYFLLAFALEERETWSETDKIAMCKALNARSGSGS